MFSLYRLLGGGGKIAFSHTAEGTEPIIGDILEGSTRRDSVVRITLGRIVYIPTYITHVFLHIHSFSRGF
jgi:hypothetical protein